MTSKDLVASVDEVGEAWAESPYYADAEEWTFIFWNDGTLFRSAFDRMNLEAVLELACGHGRHAERVVARSGSLVVADIHEANLEVCRRRLEGRSNVTFLKNNGFDFQPVPNESLTSIFCYDAMVHFAPEVVASYLQDTRRVLKKGGMALYHHSNYAAPRDRRYGQNPHARNHMTQELFRSHVDAAGLDIVESSPLVWGTDENLDRLTLVQRPE